MACEIQIDQIVKFADVAIKGLALLGAGLFFAWKVATGFNNQNLSLYVECKRVGKSTEADGADVVATTITVEKGTTSATTIEGLEIRFKWGETKGECK